MAVNEGDWPVLLSLECHVPVEGQEELVRIMEGIWGEKLVRKEVREDGREVGDVTPGELRGKIVAMVDISLSLLYSHVHFAELLWMLCRLSTIRLRSQRLMASLRALRSPKNQKK